MPALILYVGLLVAVLKLLERGANPLVCACLFTLGNAAISLVLLHTPPVVAAIASAICFVYCMGWFHLLDRYSDESAWYVILVIGTALPGIANIFLMP